MAFNLRELNFLLLIRHSVETREEYGYLVVFRQFLMHYIHSHRETANFVIYSLADQHGVIPHVIAMELYYNYVYQFTVNPKQFRQKPQSSNPPINMFKFDFVIARLRYSPEQVVRTKSFGILTKLIGELRRFENIFIVDDRAHHVWKNGIPKKLNKSSCRIFPIQATTYNVHAGPSFNWDTVMSLSDQRAKDEYLHSLTDFIKRLHFMMIKPTNGSSSSWITYENIKFWFYRRPTPLLNKVFLPQ